MSTMIAKTIACLVSLFAEGVGMFSLHAELLNYVRQVHDFLAAFIIIIEALFN